MDKINHILVVEDSQIQALLLKRLLLKNNYDVDVAVNGAEGIEFTKKTRPDIIISDVAMPVMDGYEMCSRIKSDEKLKDIPLILLTQLSSTADIISGINSLADSFITKPYSDSYLLYVINNSLSSKRLNEEGIKQQNLLNKYVDHITSNSIITNGDISRILTFLFSTYEHKIFQSKEQLEIQNTLKTLNEELKKRINELKTSEGRYQGIFVSVNDIIYSLDKDGRFIYINEAVTRYGYIPSKLIERHFSEIFMPYCLDKDNKVIDVDFDLIIKGTDADKKQGVADHHAGNLRQLLLKINRISKSQISKNMRDMEYVLVEINNTSLYNSLGFQDERIFIGSSGTIRDISTRIK